MTDDVNAIDLDEAASAEVPDVVFILTGAREGKSVILNDRYQFVKGKMQVSAHMKDSLKRILCARYGCNIEGEAPLWATKDLDGKKASISVRALQAAKARTTTVASKPTTSVKD